MLHAGLDLSRRKLDVCLLSDRGEHLDQLAVPPDVDSLRRLARRIAEVHCQPVCAVIESMTGARIMHDTLEQQGWSVEIADAQKVKGLAPLACKTDKIDSKVLAVLSRRATAAADRGRAAGRAATETPRHASPESRALGHRAHDRARVPRAMT